MLKPYKSKQFLKFLVAGGIAAIVNFGSRFIFNLYLSYEKSILFAYLLGMITAFILTKVFVFAQSQYSTKKEFFIFTLVNIVAIVQTYYISIGLHDYLFPQIDFNFHNKAAAHAIGVAFPVFTSFIGHKYFSFREQ